MEFHHAAFLRTTLPLDFSGLDALDSGRFHSIWLPDHMVSIWPDSVWTPEFTDLATVSPSPHRHLDAFAVAAAVAARTKNVSIATCVADTARRHPAMLAQTALTIDHIARGRFILGLGSGEMENVVPYGYDFNTPVSRFEEALHVIRLLWESDGPVDFNGRFFKLDHARLDTEPFEGRYPRIWLGANGPRMIDIAGRYADGWWPMVVASPDDYADKLGRLRNSAERAGRDPQAITPCMVQPCFIGDDAEIAEALKAPLIKCHVLTLPAEALRAVGFSHPLGESWRGVNDLDPNKLTRDVILDLIEKVTDEMLLALVPHGTPAQVAKTLKTFVDVGARVVSALDYTGMAGVKFGARSAQKTRETEDELRRLARGV
jgi:phthiodiolone/phenolphthiodiolone dimycocerosates ketoreductase